MAQIVKWNDIAFTLGGTSILGVEGLSIAGSCETEDSTVDGEKFVTRKNGKPYEISMTAILDARLGIDVQSTAVQMTEAARKSESGYFYTGSAKLFPCSFMMISADISDMTLNSSGVWISCKVKLKLKQGSKYDGSTASASGGGDGGGGSSGGGSSGKKSTKSQSPTKDEVDAVSMAAPNVQPTSSTPATVVNGNTMQQMQEAARMMAESAANAATQTTKSAQQQSADILKKANSSNSSSGNKVVKSNATNSVKSSAK